MDDETLLYFDNAEIGDWVQVQYSMGGDQTTLEGEFYGWGRTSRGNYFMRIRGLMLIPTADIVRIRVVIPAGCL